MGVVFRTGSSYIGVANLGSHKEKRMGKLIAGLMALALALSSATAVACSAEKAKDGKSEMSTPAQPKN
ncbi:MAG: hypothetical protein JNK06_09425 [Candidatus Accumulibacter phosphatis]|nr:hypothetical protein [Candidatus Accumulibacter phosphatis]